MKLEKRNKVDRYQLLSAVRDIKAPVGAMYLSQILALPQATVGRYLLKLEKEGCLKQVGNKGRVLTEKGKNYLDYESLHQRREKTANSLINIVLGKERVHLKEVIEIRMLLEVYAVEQACLRATNEDFQELDRIMLEYVREVRYGGSGDELDLQTHLSLAKFSQNAVLYQILKIILTQDKAYAQFASISEKRGSIIKCLEQHEAIVNAVKSRNVEAAKKAMETHLNKVMNDIKSNGTDVDNHENTINKSVREESK